MVSHLLDDAGVVFEQHINISLYLLSNTLGTLGMNHWLSITHIVPHLPKIPDGNSEEIQLRSIREEIQEPLLNILKRSAKQSNSMTFLDQIPYLRGRSAHPDSRNNKYLWPVYVDDEVELPWPWVSMRDTPKHYLHLSRNIH